FGGLLHFAHLDDVPAEFGLDRAAHFAGLHREHGVLERLGLRAARDVAEVAAVGLGTGVVGVGARERGEVRTRLLGFGSELVRLVFGGLLHGGVGIGRHGDEDVGDQAFALRAELVLFLFVALAQRGFVGRRHAQRG